MAFASDRVDRAWLHAWLEGRSLARGLPMPVADRGGWRVETGSASEVRRWVLAGLSPEVAALASKHLPGHAIRATVESEHLRAALPDSWVLGPPTYCMRGPDAATPPVALPPGFSLELRKEGPVARAFVLDPEGMLAASGHAGAGRQAYVYDRIVTQDEFRRQGLGRAVMAALREVKPDAALPDLLVATAAGRELYEKLGWETLGPYASASWPA